MSGHVEREILLQHRDRAEIALAPQVGELLEGGVGSLHVRRVVLVVVQLHDPTADVRFECPEVVGQVGQGVRGGCHRPLLSLVAIIRAYPRTRFGIRRPTGSGRTCGRRKEPA